MFLRLAGTHQTDLSRHTRSLGRKRKKHWESAGISGELQSLQAHANLPREKAFVENVEEAVVRKKKFSSACCIALKYLGAVIAIRKISAGPPRDE